MSGLEIFKKDKQRAHGEFCPIFWTALTWVCRQQRTKDKVLKIAKDPPSTHRCGIRVFERHEDRLGSFQAELHLSI
jgi:hypothetical protein